MERIEKVNNGVFIDDCFYENIKNPLFHAMRQMIIQARENGQPMTASILRSHFIFIEDQKRVEESLRILHAEGLIDSPFIEPEQLPLNLPKKSDIAKPARSNVIRLFNK